MEKSQQKLSQALGLSSYEARIYLAIIGSTGVTVSEIAKLTDIPRTAIYPPLQSLIRQGLLSPIKGSGKRLRYRATEPQFLKHILERRMVDLEEITVGLAQYITATESSLDIRFFEGREGVQLAGDIFLRETKTKLWKTFENPAASIHATGTLQLDKYVDKRVKKNIRAKTIIPANNADILYIKEKLSKNNEELRDVVFVSPQAYPLDASIAVTEHMTLIMATKANFFALLIKNESLAKTISSIHDMVWDRFKNEA